MSDLQANFVDPERVKQYVEVGPPAFTPGHSGLLQMIDVLLGETVPNDGQLLVVGAGGGLEIRYLASVEDHWRFVGVDPASAMLDLARAVAGPVTGDRMMLIRGTVNDAPLGPFDGATCVLVLGLIPDDGSKLMTLEEARCRLEPGAPFILVDQCINLSAPDAPRRLERSGNHALRSGIAADTVANAKAAIGSSTKPDFAAPNCSTQEWPGEAGSPTPEHWPPGSLAVTTAQKRTLRSSTNMLTGCRAARQQVTCNQLLASAGPLTNSGRSFTSILDKRWPRVVR